MVIWSESNDGEWTLGEREDTPYQRVDIPLEDWREMVARAAGVDPEDVWPSEEPY